MQLRRGDVLDGAMAILDEFGLADLTMRRLATSLGVQPGALYWHFPNKQTLLGAVVDKILEDLDAPPLTRTRGKRRIPNWHTDFGLPYWRTAMAPSWSAPPCFADDEQQGARAFRTSRARIRSLTRARPTRGVRPAVLRTRPYRGRAVPSADGRNGGHLPEHPFPPTPPR